MTDNLIKRDRTVHWLDCSVGTVIAGIEQSESGQITRLYYESYGNPAEDPGMWDTSGPRRRRVLTLRALDVIPFTSDERPTIAFEDAEGVGYYLTQFNRVLEYPEFPDHPDVERDQRKSDTDEVLAVQDNDKLRAVGVNVALTIPDNEHMSPQLTDS